MITPTSIITRGLIGCNDFPLAVITRGYICTTVVVELPCRRVVTDITELSNTSLLEVQLNVVNIEWIQNQTNVLELVDASDIEEEINASNITSLVVYASSDLVELLNNSNVESSCFPVSQTIITDEIIYNGTFDTDVSLWFGIGGTPQWNAGELSIGAFNATATAYQPHNSDKFEAGYTYTFSYEIINTGSVGMQISSNATYNSGTIYVSNLTSAPGVYQVQFNGSDITSPYVYFTFTVGGSGFHALTLDNVSLIGEGTVTKAHCGFSNIEALTNLTNMSKLFNKSDIIEKIYSSNIKCRGFRRERVYRADSSIITADTTKLTADYEK